MRKNYCTNIFLFFCISSSVIACKKEEINNNLTATGYIEFKLDGITHRVNDYGTSAVTYSDNSSLPLYQFITAVMEPNGNEMPLLQQISNSPIALQKYTYTAYNSTQHPYFSFSVNSGNNIYVFDAVNQTGEIEFIKLDRQKGGTVQGKFFFNNLNYLDKNQNIISTAHNLTEGSFSFVIR